MSDNLEDLRSVETLREQADAWEKVYGLCLQLGAHQKPASLDTVLNFIRYLYKQERKFARLMKYVNSGKDDDQ